MGLKSRARNGPRGTDTARSRCTLWGGSARNPNEWSKEPHSPTNRALGRTPTSFCTSRTPNSPVRYRPVRYPTLSNQPHLHIISGHGTHCLGHGAHCRSRDAMPRSRDALPRSWASRGCHVTVGLSAAKTLIAAEARNAKPLILNPLP